VHRRVFGDVVAFGQAFSGIVRDAAEFDVPNPGANSVMARHAHRTLEQTARRAAGMTARVDQLILLLRPRGHCRFEISMQPGVAPSRRRKTKLTGSAATRPSRRR
jgi:hypothetical protein